MATEVKIAKLALQHIGDRYDISALDEATVEAEQVNLVFNPTRDAMLRSYNWAFAKKYISPATLTGTVPNNWDYMYQYPSDCLRVRNIVNPTKGDPTNIPYELATNDDDSYVILTDQVDAQICYTKKVEDPTKFDPEFVMALSYAIAARIAHPLTGDLQLAQLMGSMAVAHAGAATESDANEDMQTDDQDADWINARA